MVWFATKPTGPVHYGLHMIDEKALVAMYEDAFLALRNTQALSIVYALYFSMPQTHLLARLARLTSQPRRATENLDSFFGCNKDLSFDFDD